MLKGLRARLFFGVFTGALLIPAGANAFSSKDLAEAAIQKHFPNTRIVLREGAEELQAISQSTAEVRQIQWVTEQSPGLVTLRIYFEEPSQGTILKDLRVKFSALQKTVVATRRIRPGERLEASFFRLEEVDVAQGIGREMRGLLFPPDTQFENLEATQTILPGNFPILSGVQKVPDIKRGDAVNLKVISNGMTLSTRGIAQEPSYQGKSIRVLTSGSKREMTGILSLNNVVEVKL